MTGTTMSGSAHAGDPAHDGNVRQADARARGIRLAYYGDDFTGSTDTLATVVSAGWRAVLFLDVPTAEDLARFGPLDCVGVAGTARAMAPAEMDEALPRIFRGLAATGADVVHYKTCSTFDSAPHIGSIGHAVALAWRELGTRPAYIIGGQPNLGRYCSFAHLYARAGQGGQVYRLDRHPTMSRHPVTPMDEADLRVHLARQGLDGIVSFDIAMLEDDELARTARLDALVGAGASAVLFDVTRVADLPRIGALLWHRQGVEPGPLLTVGPTGAVQALLAADRGSAAGSIESAESAASAESTASTASTPSTASTASASTGLTAPAASASSITSTAPPRARPVNQTFILAGSRSPITAAQIDAAEQTGFVSIALDAAALADGDSSYAESLASRVVQALGQGRSVVAHSTLGDDSGAARPGFTRALAEACGRLMAGVLARHPLARAGFAGGDTSSIAVQSWGARALTFTYAPSPGVAVCRVHAPGHPADGVELMLKGGQMGPPTLFADLLRG
ncbi:MAG TPA: four-carbon acid sugar kinase family protein [Bordetella sp.]|nr:four-carbon acid sugar kinase family protein [Bordetella sp.]